MTMRQRKHRRQLHTRQPARIAAWTKRCWRAFDRTDDAPLHIYLDIDFEGFVVQVKRMESAIGELKSLIPGPPWRPHQRGNDR